MSEPTERSDPDLVDRLLTALDHVLDEVHDRILRPIIMAARAVAFGFILVVVAVVFLVVVAVGLIRFLNIYAFTGREWLSYVVVGGLTLSTGLVIWRRRRVNLRKK